MHSQNQPTSRSERVSNISQTIANPRQGDNEDLDPCFPPNLNDYQVGEALGGGSNSVYVLRHKENSHRLVIKLGTHQESGKLEILCNALYQAMGVNI